MEFRGNQPQPEHAAHGETPTACIWEAKLAPFLDRHCLVLCLCLVGIACVRIVSTYNALSITADEPIHFVCGLEYVAKHVYRIEPQHPPLSRMMEALGPYLIGVRPADLSDPVDNALTPIARSGQVERVVFLMRLGNLPFFLLSCLVVGIWGNMFGRPMAVLAVALFTLLPTSLADAGLATTDMALGATVGAAFLAFIFWAEKPTMLRSVLLGLCMALACLSKFTALGYVPAAMALAVGCHVAVRWPGWRELWRLVKRHLVPTAVAASITALLIWACYWFSFGPVHTYGHDVRVPAPEFFEGIRFALHHNRLGHGAFLFGKFSWTGWWYYFPVVLLLKTPIAFLVLLGLGALVCLGERARPINLLPLAFSLGILLPAMHGNVNIGVRHVEPIYIGFSIISALGLRQLLQWTRRTVAPALTAVVLISWMILSAGVQHPDYLAYLNAFAGKTPENVLTDSNYDWGQDLKFLAKRLRQLGVQEFSLASLDGLGLDHNDYREAWYGLPTIKPVDTCIPSPGWNVLSPTIEKSISYWPGNRFYRGRNMVKPWYEQVTPTERVGPLLLYFVPPDAKLNCQ
jgi:hypothetical protein